MTSTLQEMKEALRPTRKQVVSAGLSAAIGVALLDRISQTGESESESGTCNARMRRYMAHLSLEHKDGPVGAIQEALKKGGAKSENLFIEALSEVDLKPVVTRWFQASGWQIFGRPTENDEWAERADFYGYNVLGECLFGALRVLHGIDDSADHLISKDIERVNAFAATEEKEYGDGVYIITVFDSGEQPDAVSRVFDRVTRSLETRESNGSRYRINIEESGAAWDPPQDHRSLHVLSWVC